MTSLKSLPPSWLRHCRSPPVRVLSMTEERTTGSTRIPFFGFLDSPTFFSEEDGPHNRIPQLNALNGKRAVFLKLTDLNQLHLAVQMARHCDTQSFDKVQFDLWEDSLIPQESSRCPLLVADFKETRSPEKKLNSQMTGAL